MKREVCKFFSGSFAALAYVHVAYAAATSRGIINEPVFHGRKWGVGYLLAEAAVYSAASLALGYVGWRTSESQEQSQKSTMSATDGQSARQVRAGEEPQLVSR